MCICTIFSSCRCIALTAIFKVRILGSPKTARDEQDCAHQKSYRKQIFLNVVEAMHVGDIAVFSAASDGATANRKIPNRISVNFYHVEGG